MATRDDVGSRDHYQTCQGQHRISNAALGLNRVVIDLPSFADLQTRRRPLGGAGHR